MTAIKIHSGMEAFLIRSRRIFQTYAVLGKVSSTAFLLFRRSVTHRLSQFVKCQNSIGNTQVLCFLLIFAEDVDTEKVFSRFGDHRLCERCQRCMKVLPQFGIEGKITFHVQLFCIPP